MRALGAPLAPARHCRCASREDCESTESPSESVPHDARASPYSKWIILFTYIFGSQQDTPDDCCITDIIRV